MYMNVTGFQYTQLFKIFIVIGLPLLHYCLLLVMYELPHSLNCKTIMKKINIMIDLKYNFQPTF